MQQHNERSLMLPVKPKAVILAAIVIFFLVGVYDVFWYFDGHLRLNHPYPFVTPVIGIIMLAASAFLAWRTKWGRTPF